ncbi:MAG: DMT family transporter [Proteobacteria bacterium]|nr:DMT family transporter [Pseudomonadota bacterium]MBI3495958.1 DMT family transporter [Pseudomonadota bacterium]
MPPAPTTDHPLRGILLILAAMALFNLADGLSKYLAGAYQPIQVVWGRYLFHAVFLAPFVLRRGMAATLASARPRVQWARALVLISSSLVFMFALAHLGLAEAITVGFVSPLFITALSVPLLGEKVGVRRWLAVLIGFLGIVVIVRPGTAAFDPWALLPLLSSALWALGVIGTRVSGQIDSPLTTVSYNTLVGLVVTSALTPFVWSMPGAEDWLVFAIGGGGNVLGQYLMVRAFAVAPASMLAPFSYSQLLWSTLIGWLLFQAVPDVTTYFGAAIIIASGIYVWHRERAAAMRATDRRG